MGVYKSYPALYFFRITRVNSNSYSWQGILLVGYPIQFYWDTFLRACYLHLLYFKITEERNTGLRV